jgi:hypothetical protein
MVVFPNTITDPEDEKGVNVPALTKTLPFIVAVPDDTNLKLPVFVLDIVRFPCIVTEDNKQLKPAVEVVEL